MDGRSGRMLATLVLALMVVPVASALDEDPDTYPDIVDRVNRPDAILPRSDWTVQVTLAEDVSADSVRLYVCQYKQAGDEAPDVCYMPVTAAGNDRWFEGDTSDTEHPVWKDGTELGYKLMVIQGEGLTKVPVDGGYYRVMVEAPQDEVATVDSDDGPVQESPAPPLWMLMVALGLVASRRR